LKLTDNEIKEKRSDIMKKFLLIICLFVLIQGVSGCGDNGGILLPTPTPVPISTSVPTVTPVPPTATPATLPSLLTSIRDSWEEGKGDDVDPDSTPGIMYFTLMGTNFGNITNSVTFNYSSGGTGSIPVITATINKWSDKEIQGSVNLEAGVYLIKVKVGTQTTENNIYYYKGSGSSTITID
jgi:hypothetical protein